MINYKTGMPLPMNMDELVGRITKGLNFFYIRCLNADHETIHALLLAIILTGLATIVRLMIAPVNDGFQYLTFFPAVAVAAVFGGYKSGLLATIFGLIVVTHVFILPYNGFSIEGLRYSLMPNMVFLTDGIVVSFLIESMHRYRAKYTIESMHRYRAKYTNEFKLSQPVAHNLMRYASIIESSDDAIISETLEGIITGWNRGAEQIFGYIYEEVHGRNITILIPEERRNEETILLERIDTSIPVKHYETIRRCKDGKLIDISVTLSPLLDRNGKIVGASKIARDITEQKLAEKMLLRNEANLCAMMDNSPFMTWLKDTDGHYLMINRVYADSVNLLDAKEAIGKTDLDMHPKVMAEKHLADDNEVIATRSQIHIEETVFDGESSICVETYKTPVIDVHDKVIGTVGFARDISKRKKTEQELQIAATAFETFDAIMITDADANIIKVNKSFTRISGYTEDEVIGKNPRLMNSGRHDKAFFSEMFSKLKRDGSWTGEIWDKHKNGEIYPRSMTITAVINEQQKLTNYVGIFKDISDTKKNEEIINHLAFYDTLTQLPNRRLLDDRLEQAFAASKRSKNFGAVLFLDLDNFKPLNDKHGHKAGDLLLMEIAKRLGGCVREVDTVARFGGDEFVVVLTELDANRSECYQEAQMVAEKIRTALGQPYWLASNSNNSTKMIIHYDVGASIGIAIFNDESNVEKILKNADHAMYEAKEGGRNSIRFFEPNNCVAEQLSFLLNSN